MTRGKILSIGTLSLSALAFLCIPRHLPPVPTAPATSSFSATLDSQQLTLSGTMRADIHRAILTRAQELLRGSQAKLVDHVIVNDRAEAAEWEPALPVLLNVLLSMQEKGVIDVHDQAVTVAGLVKGPEQKNKVMREVKEALGSTYQIDDHVAVLRTPATPGDSPPRLSRATVQSTIDDILRREAIGFESNSAMLTPRGRSVLDKVVPVLQRAPELAVEVGGHTDSFGDPAYNMQLSQRRADSVRQYLVKQHVPNHITAVGYGSTRPLLNDRTRAAQQKNRRIELRLKEEH